MCISCPIFQNKKTIKVPHTHPEKRREEGNPETWRETGEFACRARSREITQFRVRSGCIELCGRLTTERAPRRARLLFVHLTIMTPADRPYRSEDGNCFGPSLPLSCLPSRLPRRGSLDLTHQGVRHPGCFHPRELWRQLDCVEAQTGRLSGRATCSRDGAADKARTCFS